MVKFSIKKIDSRLDTILKFWILFLKTNGNLVTVFNILYFVAKKGMKVWVQLLKYHWKKRIAVWLHTLYRSDNCF